MNRRLWILTVISGFLASLQGQTSSSKLLDTSSEVIEEEHISDPGAKAEMLVADSAVLEAPLLLESTGPKVEAEKLAAEMLKISNDYARRGVSRSTSPSTVIQFLSIFGFGLRYSKGGNYVPYCAAGVSFAACKAYCNLAKIPYDNDSQRRIFITTLSDINAQYFKPSAAVRVIMADAKNKERNTWASSKTKPKAGWLVVFSWRQNGVPNHIGLVERSEGNAIYTVEYNTSSGSTGSQSNGGAVARRKRSLGSVLGYVKTW